MPNTSYEIRQCGSCGLRYPLVQGHPFGTRCPACMGDTRLLLSRQLVTEPDEDSRRRQTSEEGKDERGERKKERGTVIAVLLDNIRSAWNVGSILRSADGFGFSHVYLCGITPTADNESVAKTALGAEDSVPWSYHKDAVRLVKGLKTEGWQVLALEDDPRSRPITQSPDHKSPNFSVLILGSEVTGVDPELLDLCDQIFYIPMLGEKKSFNVAIAFSIAAYALSVQEPRV
ncbi:MAG TPA: RNA methyltransferase [Anaerolineales bacterium]|nr:RNA methyltransferase [Anaerolineales bacterium]